jgi:protein import protein ZIM17
LGWFNESTEDGTLKTVEDLLKARGEQVRRGVATGGKGDDGTLEYVLE